MLIQFKSLSPLLLALQQKTDRFATPPHQERHYTTKQISGTRYLVRIRVHTLFCQSRYTAAKKTACQRKRMSPCEADDKRTRYARHPKFAKNANVSRYHICTRIRSIVDCRKQVSLEKKSSQDTRGPGKVRTVGIYVLAFRPLKTARQRSYWYCTTVEQ